jgi:hypothetical protein
MVKQKTSAQLVVLSLTQKQQPKGELTYKKCRVIAWPEDDMEPICINR